MAVKPFEDVSAEISSDTADTEIHDRPGGVRRIIVTAAGAASSEIKVYDGTVAAGKCVGQATGVADAAGQLANVEINAWCKTSIHVYSADSGSALRYVIVGHFRA
jgi:hypothetical protein